jgi:hypothetical protein
MLTSLYAGPKIRELTIKARRIAVGLGKMDIPLKFVPAPEFIPAVGPSKG